MGPEVELVTRTERRNIVLTFAAATATVVAVVAVLAGPAMLDCAESPDGIVACLRDKVAGYGLLPGREPSVPAAEPAAETGAPTGVTAAQPGAPELTFLRAQPDGAAVIGGTAGAGAHVAVYANGELLGTVTAERSGDWALIPDAPLPVGGAEIVVRGVEDGATGTVSFVVVVDPRGIAQPTVVATTPEQASQVLRDLGASPEVATPTEPPMAEPKPQPAPAAEHEPEPAADEAASSSPPAEIFTVRAEVPRPLHIGAGLVAQAGIEGQGSGRLVVSTPEPQVVAPDPFTLIAAVPLHVRFGGELVAAVGARAAASTVLDVPAPRAIIASADPFTIVPEAPLVLEAGVGLSAAAGIGTTAPAALEFPGLAVKVAAAERFTIVPEVQRPLGMDIGVVGVPGIGDTVVAAIDVPPAVVPAPDPFTIVPEIVRPQLPEVLVAVAEPEAEIPVLPTIEAIEIDGRMTYFAGAAEEGSTVRLFIGDRLVGESAVEGGRWLVEAADALTAPSQRIRAEMSLSSRQAVVSAVEADVMLGLPEVSGEGDASGVVPENAGFDAQRPEQTAMAGRQAAVEIATASFGGVAGIVAVGPRFKVAGLTPPATPADEPEPYFEPIGIGPGSVAGAAGIARDLARVEIAALPRPSEPAALPPDSKPMPVASPSVEVLALPDATPSVVELASTDTDGVGRTDARDNEVQTIRTVPAHDLGAARFSSGKAIIRRGDTLWDIADRVYGDGYKYRTIYRANRDKIRRPGRIYPGQVLDIPLVFDDR